MLGEDIEAPIFSDNQACIALAGNTVNHSRSKHIDVRYHYIRDLIASKRTTVEYCPTEDMVADLLTKPLSLQRTRKLIGGLLA